MRSRNKKKHGIENNRKGILKKYLNFSGLNFSTQGVNFLTASSTEEYRKFLQQNENSRTIRISSLEQYIAVLYISTL